MRIIRADCAGLLHYRAKKGKAPPGIRAGAYALPRGMFSKWERLFLWEKMQELFQMFLQNCIMQAHNENPMQPGKPISPSLCPDMVYIMNYYVSFTFLTL